MDGRGIEAEQADMTGMPPNQCWSWVLESNRWPGAYQLLPWPQSPVFYVGAALYNLIYNSNNDDGQEKKIITNNEKKYYPFSAKSRQNVACHPQENAGSWTIKGCFSRDWRLCLPPHCNWSVIQFASAPPLEIKVQASVSDALEREVFSPLATPCPLFREHSPVLLIIVLRWHYYSWTSISKYLT